MKLYKHLVLLAVAAASFIVAGCIKDPELQPAEIGVNVETTDFTADGGNATVKLFSNRDWKAEIVGSDSQETTWLTISQTEGAAMTDSLSITVTVLPNSETDRQATINFRTETIYASVRVSQKGTVQKEYTPISTVRGLYTDSNVTITEDYTIKGSVISNYMSSDNGGLNNATSAKTLVISDGNYGISLYLTANNTLYKVGDEITVKLKGLELQRYNNGALQVNAVPADVIEVVGQKVIDAKPVTAAQLVSGDFESMYVAVSDVQVLSSDMGKKFVEGEKHTSINFISKTGEKFVLFSSSYSTFGSETVPTGSGVLKGIAMVYGSNYQVSITSVADYAGLTGERFTESGGGEEPGDGAVIGDYAKWNAIAPVSSFGDDFGSVSAGNEAYNNDNWMFYTNDGAGINLGWKTGTFNNTETGATDKYIQIAPYSSTLDQVVAYALIPRANVSTAAVKNLKFKLALYYKEADASKLEVVTSKDFSGDFAGATWTVLQDVSFAADAALNTWVEKVVDLTSLAAETSLCIAFRYTGKANTYRLDDVQFAEGTFPDPGEGGGDNPGGGEGGGAGDGVYTSNVDITSNISAGKNCYAYKVNTAGASYDGLKIGKSKEEGSYTTTALPLTGDMTLTFYAVAWNNASCNLTVTINNGGTIDSGASKTYSLTANPGTASTTSEGTLTFGSTDFYTVSLSGVTSSSTITFATASAGPRAVMVGVNVKAASN